MRQQDVGPLSTAGAILAWAREQAVHAEENGCTLTRFIFPANFERYLYSRMMTDRTVMIQEFNVEPTAVSGVTVTTLIGVPCKFDKRLPHGKTLLLYDTHGAPWAPEVEDTYPGDNGPRAA